MISEPSSEGQIQLHYRELAEYLPDSLLFILDRHLDVVFAGGSLLAKSRWPRNAIAGMPLADLMPPGVYAQAEPHLRGALGGQEQSYLLNYPTGEAFDVRAAPLPGEDGTTPHVLVVAHDITAHKHAQESQRLLEKRLRLAIQAVNVGLWDWDLATNRVHYSREWKRQLGYAEDEIGEDFGEWEQRVHPDDLARARSTALTYVAVPWPNYEQEYRMRHKDGTYRWILTRAALVYNEDGRAMRMLGSHIDITEKKRAELAVAESERFARATLDGLSAHIAIVDAAGTIVAVNRAWREFAAANRPANPLADLPATGGLSEGANYVAVCRAAVAAGCTEAQLWLDAMQAVLGGAAELVDFEYPCHGPHEQRWFVVRISRMPGDVPPRLVIAHENITRRKLIELEREELLHRLHHQAEQMVQVMYSVPEGVLVLDSRRHVLLANKHAEANLALLATFDLDAQLVQLGGTDLDQLLLSSAQGQWHTLEADGRRCELIARPVEPGPLSAGWVMILRDVTVERAVQDQLQRQERLAAVGQLAAGIAHDFNNIMSVISIYAELLGGAPSLTGKERAHTQTIIAQAERATRMIRQILDFSRQSVFERQELDLLPLLKEHVKLLRQTLPENIDLQLDASPGEYRVLADPTRIQQLVMNLAVNARDAMPPVGGRLRIALSRLQLGPQATPPLPGVTPGSWLQLVVSDTGSGIAPNHLAHIFEPFFTTKALGKGTGLGLAQVHGIVALHDGHITVASELGAGTVFTIYLPALAAAENPRAQAMAHVLQPQGHGESILVVEDEAAVRASLLDLLELWHYQVTPAANGEEALAWLLAAPGRVNLIITDVVMPRLGGIGLVKALRQQGINTPVILLSGHTAGEDRAGLEDAGIVAWLDKPPSSWLLAQTVAQALSNT